MSPIEKLTKQQEARIPFYRNKWLERGLSTEKVDRQKANQIIDDVYSAAGMLPPKIKVWLSSPMQGAIGAEYLKLLVSQTQVEGQVRTQVGSQVRTQVWAQVGDQVRTQVVDQVVDQVGSQVWDQVRAQVRAQVRTQVWAQVGDQVRTQVVDQVRTQVWAQVGAQVRTQVWDQVGSQVLDQVRTQVWAQVGAQVVDQVRAQVWAQVRDQVRSQVGKCGYGLHDANWLGFYDFFKSELSLECCAKLIPLMNLSEHCGWWWPFNDAVILTEKPTSLHHDSQFRLHHLDKPAMLYHDGWGIYAIHGVRVPEYYILTPAEGIDVAKALQEPNSSVRMAVIKKIGFLRLKEKLPTKTVSKTQSADLLEFDLGEIKVRGLHVKWDDKFLNHLETIIPVPRTKEQFGEDCPENIDDAEQVRKWTLWMKQDETFEIET